MANYAQVAVNTVEEISIARAIIEAFKKQNTVFAQQGYYCSFIGFRTTRGQAALSSKDRSVLFAQGTIHGITEDSAGEVSFYFVVEVSPSEDFAIKDIQFLV